jgi:hypothetical protein
MTITTKGATPVPCHIGEAARKDSGDVRARQQNEYDEGQWPVARSHLGGPSPGTATSSSRVTANLAHEAGSVAHLNRDGKRSLQIAVSGFGRQG